MANPYYVNPPNILESLMMGQQGFDSARQRSRQGDIEAARLAASQGDPRDALQRLIAAGDLQGANLYAGMADRAENRAIRLAESDRAQRNTDRSFGLQQQQFDLARRQADAAAKGFDLREVDDPANPGTKILVRTEKATGQSTVVPISGAEERTPPNPYAPTGKLTEGQAKDRSYVNRMVEAHDIINGLEGINEGVSGFLGGVAASNPAIRDSAAFNLSASADRQKILQAQRNFVNATLRRESGAVINKDEFDNANRQYFPMPGDGPEVIEQKRRNRQVTIEGMMQGAGPGYKPPASYIGTKGQAPGPPAQSAPSQPASAQPRKTKTGVTWSVGP